MELTPNIQYTNSDILTNLSKNKLEILDGGVVLTKNKYNWREYEKKIMYGSLLSRITKLYNLLKAGNTSFVSDFDISFTTNYNNYVGLVSPLPTLFEEGKIIIDTGSNLDTWYEDATIVSKTFDMDNIYKLINNIPLLIKDSDNDIIITFFEILGNYLDEIRIEIDFQNYFFKKDTFRGDNNELYILNQILSSKGLSLKRFLDDLDYKKFNGKQEDDYLEISDLIYKKTNKISDVDLSEIELSDRLNYFDTNFNTVTPYNLNIFGYNYAVDKYFDNKNTYTPNNLTYTQPSILDSYINIRQRILSDINHVIQSKATYPTYKLIGNIFGLDTKNFYTYNYNSNYEETHDKVETQISYVKLKDNLDWVWDNTYQSYTNNIELAPTHTEYLLTVNMIIDIDYFSSINYTGAKLNLGSKYITYNGLNFYGDEILPEFNYSTRYIGGMKYKRDGQAYIINDYFEEEEYIIPLQKLTYNFLKNKWFKLIIEADKISIIINDKYYIINTTTTLSSNPFDMFTINEGMIPYVGINQIIIDYYNNDDMVYYPLGNDGDNDINSINPHLSFVDNIDYFKNGNKVISKKNLDYSLKKFSINGGESTNRIDIGYNIGRILDNNIEINSKIKEDYTNSDGLYLFNNLNTKRREYLHLYNPITSINNITESMGKYTNLESIYDLVNKTSNLVIVGNILETPNLGEHVYSLHNNNKVINIDEGKLYSNYVFNENETQDNNSLTVYDADSDYSLNLT